MSDGENREVPPNQQPRFADRFKQTLHRIRNWDQSNETRETVQTTQLKEYLLAASKSPLLAADPAPASFDLGIFGKEAEMLVQKSAIDPKTPEYFTGAYVDENSRLLLLNKPIRGTQFSVQPPHTKGKKLVLGIHTHGIVDSPFSSGDFVPLFLPKDKHGNVAQLLATPSIKLLIIRTKNTPLLDQIRLYNMKVMFDQIYNQKETELFRKRYKETGHYTKDVFTIEDIQTLQEQSHRRMNAIIQTAQEYNLKLYASKPGEDIAYPAY